MEKLDVLKVVQRLVAKSAAYQNVTIEEWYYKHWFHLPMFVSLALKKGLFVPPGVEKTKYQHFWFPLSLVDGKKSYYVVGEYKGAALMVSNGEILKKWAERFTDGKIYLFERPAGKNKMVMIAAHKNSEECKKAIDKSAKDKFLDYSEAAAFLKMEADDLKTSYKYSYDEKSKVFVQEKSP